MTVGHRPTRAEIEAARLILAPWRWMTAPCFEGLEHVPPDRPFLLAGNYTLMGVLDAPLIESTVRASHIGGKLVKNAGRRPEAARRG